MNSSRQRSVPKFMAKIGATAEGSILSAHKGPHVSTANVLMFCIAAAALLATMHTVLPIHRQLEAVVDRQQMPKPVTLLISGSISSCSLPSDNASAVDGQHHAGLANATAVVDVVCAFELKQGAAATSPSLTQPQHQQQQLSVLKHIHAAGLDSLTCAVASAVSNNRVYDDDLLSTQQQYVFLLQRQSSKPMHGMAMAAEPTYHIVEYAPIQHAGSSLQALSGLLLSKWGGASGITAHGCYDQSQAIFSNSADTQSPPHVLGVQQRHLLQQDTLKSAANDPEPSVKAAKSSANQTSADPKALAPPSVAARTNISAVKTSQARPGNNSSAHSSAAEKGSSEEASVGATVGPANVQQQQASLEAAVPQQQTSKSPGSSSTAVVPRSACVLPSATGNCRASIPQWAYDIQQKQCVQFIWGGCGGNQNRFDSVQSCLSTCLGAEDDEGPSKGAAAGKGPTATAALSPAAESKQTQPPAPLPVPDYPVATSQLPNVMLSSATAEAPAVSSAAPSLAVASMGVQLLCAAILSTVLLSC